MFEERFELRIPEALVAAMTAQAQRELPNECCGLLCGELMRETAPSIQTATRLFPLVNALHSPRQFESDPRILFEAMRTMRHANLEILAVYHSHPTSEPIPSRFDLERNYSERVQNLILGRAGEDWTILAWWLTAEKYEPAKWTKV